MKKKKAMTYNQFLKWCEGRTVDGCWPLSVALTCTEIIGDVNTLPWWKRERYFQRNYDADGIYHNTVEPINRIYNCDRAVPKGEFE